jgi:ABC-type multidrug transport system fused ATPase/permease subunit
MQRVLSERRGGVIWVLHRAQLAHRFDRVVVVEAGQIAEQGGYDDLAGAGGTFDQLVAGD